MLFRSISVRCSCLRWSSAWTSALFKNALALRHAFSKAISLLASSVCSYLRAPKDFSILAQEWASALASLLGDLHKNHEGIPFKKRKRESLTQHLIRRFVRLLTMARSLFKDRKSSGCLKRLRASISLRKRRGCSKASAMQPERLP